METTGYYCPKGPRTYSPHKMEEVGRKQIRKGVFDVERRCKLCGGTDRATLDYVVLADVFGLPRK
jgi:hypothetical protein